MTLRVGLVLAASTGGIGRHVASLAAGLIDRGALVTVCCPADTAARFDFPGDVRTVEIPGSPGPRDRVVVSALRAALRGVDVVHAHGLRAGLVASFARRPPVPLVVTWHNPVPFSAASAEGRGAAVTRTGAWRGGGVHGALARLAARRVARAASITLGASADLVAQAVALGARDARLGPVAAPALPPPSRGPAEVRADLGVPDGAPLLLSVGRLEPQKGYHLLVDAAARWRARRVPPVVAIAGIGPDYLRLTAHISAARAKVILLGHRSDVADLLAAADVALVTSRWEARQLFAQEALRAGVPLVATAVGGLPELVGDAAVLVPAGDLDAFDRAVTRLLDDLGLLARYAAAGPVRAATWPSEAQMVEQVAAVYAELTGVPVG
jgi:glycosyltransferase involved in cell wall biosynthesis